MLARLVFKGDRSFVCITTAGAWELQLLFKRTKQAEQGRSTGMFGNKLSPRRGSRGYCGTT